MEYLAQAPQRCVGIDRLRHIAANMLWIQQKVVEKLLKIRPIGTAFNPADTGTKCLSKARPGWEV